MKIQEQSSVAQPLVISHIVKVKSDFTWTLTVHGHEVNKEHCPAMCDLPEIIGICDLTHLLVQLDQLTVCPGHPDEHFVTMANARKGSFMSSSGEVAAYVDKNVAVQLGGQTYCETVRSSKCHLLIRGTQCPECVAYRDILRSIYAPQTVEA